MTTSTPIRVTETPNIRASARAMEQLRDGLGNAEAESHDDYRLNSPDMDQHDRDRAGFAYEKTVVDEAIAEIAPYVGAMLEQAIAKRLPWTWEPER